MNLVDFHCHYSHSNNNPYVIKDNLNLPRTHYICCCLDDDNLTALTKFKTNHIHVCAGQYPLYPKYSIDINHIINLLNNNKLFAIGEIGLDKRNKDFNTQKDIFLKYCDLASQYNIPIIIHCVGYYYEIFKLLKHNFQNLIKIFHCFCPSLEIAKTLKTQLNIDNVIISINPKILNIKNSNIIIRYLTKNFNYAFETDYTYDYFPEVSYDLSLLINNIANCTKYDNKILFKNQWEVFKSLLKGC
ncbi:MAG: TatD family hydrolase [Candidatus Cloacimonetes bacterium]|nr:TatD family hydrolase [Candidatus Cloacimonadota bacterium]